MICPPTTEDALILQASRPYGYMRHAAAMMRGDDRDAQIMESIEARREWAWRVQGLRLTVAELCAYAAHELAMLEFAEKEHK